MSLWWIVFSGPCWEKDLKDPSSPRFCVVFYNVLFVHECQGKHKILEIINCRVCVFLCRRFITFIRISKGWWPLKSQESLNNTSLPPLSFLTWVLIQFAWNPYINRLWISTLIVWCISEVIIADTYQELIRRGNLVWSFHVVLSVELSWTSWPNRQNLFEMSGIHLDNIILMSTTDIIGWGRVGKYRKRMSILPLYQRFLDLKGEIFIYFRSRRTIQSSDVV